MLNRKVKTIRSLDRGLEVLQVLQKSSAMSLHDLHLATQLSKATLTRILVTLSQRGLVWQRIADGAYLPSYRLHETARQFDDVRQLVEVSSPVLERLAQKIGWPSVLAVPRLDYMEVIETNSSRAYFDHIPLGPVGARVDIIQSATGRAYLAFCSESERKAILTRLRIDETAASARELLDRILAQTRDQGYGTREPKLFAYRGHGEGHPADGRSSIAVPIRTDGQSVACLNLTWTAKVASVAEIVAEYLPDLQRAADEIGEKVAADGGLTATMPLANMVRAR